MDPQGFKAQIVCPDRFACEQYKQELDKLNGQLRSLLGDPVYPSQNRLAHKVRQTVDGLGGLMPGQTLYYKDLGTDSILAMLWPWKDGQRTTLKVIQQ